MQPSAPFTTDWMTSVTAPEHTSAYQEPRPVSIVQAGETTMFLWVWLSVQVLTHLGGVVAEDGVKREDLWLRRGGVSVGLTESQLLLPAIHSEEGRRLHGGGTDSDHHADLKRPNTSPQKISANGEPTPMRPNDLSHGSRCRLAAGTFFTIIIIIVVSTGTMNSDQLICFLTRTRQNTSLSRYSHLPHPWLFLHL